MPRIKDVTPAIKESNEKSAKPSGQTPKFSYSISLNAPSQKAKVNAEELASKPEQKELGKIETAKQISAENLQNQNLQIKTIGERIEDTKAYIKSKQIKISAKAKEIKNNPSIVKDWLIKQASKIKKTPEYLRSKWEKFKEARFDYKNAIFSSIARSIKYSMFAVDELVKFTTKQNDEGRNDALNYTRKPILFGMWVCIVTFLIGGTWAALAPLDSASSALGVVVVDSSKKIIQHREGGIVERIFIKDGDHVKKDDPLIKLSDTAIKPDLDSALAKQKTLKIMLERLKAEESGKNQLEFSDETMSKIEDPDIIRLISTQQALFTSRKNAYEGKQKILDQRTSQIEKEKEANLAKLDALRKQLELSSERLEASTELSEKSLFSKSQLAQIQANNIEISGNISALESGILRLEQQLTEVKLEKENVRSQFLSEINMQIQEASDHLKQVDEGINKINDMFSRLTITSPTDGVVSQLKIHTIGGIIQPGAPILTITPENDNLVIDAYVRSADIDSVHVGLKAKVRISAFKSRSTGPLDGTVVNVSPDVVEPTDALQQHFIQQLGLCYKVKIEVDKAQLKKISKYRDYELFPGMQADVMIVTGERTFLQYLLDPVTNTFWHAFIEK